MSTNSDAFSGRRMRRFTDVPVVGISDVGAAAAQSFNRRQLTKSAGQCGESERLAAGGTPASPFRPFCRPRRSLPESGIPPILAISAETGHALSTGRAMELEVEGICLRNRFRTEPLLVYEVTPTVVEFLVRPSALASRPNFRWGRGTEVSWQPWRVGL